MAGAGIGAFVNRTTELAALREWSARKGAGLGIVYGRKRVGKSWLLTKFAQDHRAIHHTARGRPLEEELRLLSLAADPVLQLPRRSLRDRPFSSWDDLFEVCAEAAATKPLLLILDEFPEFMAASSTLEEELRAVWDRVRVDDTHLKVLVCGSSVRVMEGLQQQHKAMFGRADLRLLVAPFRPHEAALMLSGAKPAERAAAWGVCGGIPRYLALWDDHAPFADNLARLVCNEQGVLLSEGELVLTDEDIAGHRGQRLPELLLRTIASGATTFSEISSKVGKLPTRVLSDLATARLIERVVPVGQDPATSKRTYYRIADNFLAFWLTCVEPHRGQIERGLGASVAPVMSAAFDDYMGAQYEGAFRDHLRRLATQGQLANEIVDVGEWWREQGDGQDDPCQLDAVALAGRARKPVVVGEAKWAKSVNGSSELGAMRRKLADSKFADPDSVTYYVCAREQVTRADGVQVITAADIFS